MPADITRSNLLPTAKEETILRSLLKEKGEELKVTNERVFKARSAVTSSKESILELTNSREFARITLETYAAHIKHLRSSLELFDTRFTFAPKVAANESPGVRPTACTDLSRLVTQDVCKRQANTKTEINELEEICVEIKASIVSIEEDLRCQRYVNQVNSKSLDSYITSKRIAESIVNEASSAFRAIKRVPNEIWSAILGYALDPNVWIAKAPETPIFLPALPISHVCRTWRSVVTSSASMWQAIYSALSPDDEPNCHYIDLWVKMSGKTQMMLYERQSTAGRSAAQFLRTLPPARVKDLIYYVLQSPGDASIWNNVEIIPKFSIGCLFLGRANSLANAKVQSNIYSLFSSVPQLVLSDVLPHGGLVLQASLVSLTIIFHKPHKSFALGRLLIPSLRYLRLQHFEIAGTPFLAEVVRLPNLQVLDVTPLEGELVEKLGMPNLSHLTLSSPVKATASPDGWLDSIITICTTVVDLRIDYSSTGKSAEHRYASGFNVVQILTKLLPQMSELQGITLLDAVVDGEALANTFENKETKEGLQFHKLNELTIDGCVGISQMDCERLIQWIEKLNVYRTTHKDGNLQKR